MTWLPFRQYWMVGVFWLQSNCAVYLSWLSICSHSHIKQCCSTWLTILYIYKHRHSGPSGFKQFSVWRNQTSNKTFKENWVATSNKNSESNQRYHTLQYPGSRSAAACCWGAGDALVVPHKLTTWFASNSSHCSSW